MIHSLPFSEIRKVGDLVFVAGQIGLKDGQIISEDISEQITQALKNLTDVLAKEGLGLNEIVDMSAFLVNAEDLATFNEVYIKHFKSPFPTRTTVIVKALPLSAKVEFKAVAVKS